jgi:hypothetical protein
MAGFEVIIYGRIWVITEGATPFCPSQRQKGIVLMSYFPWRLRCVGSLHLSEIDLLRILG